METVLALGILAVALLGLISVFLAGVKAVQNSAQVTTATNVGREFLELVKARGYAGTALGVYSGLEPSQPDAATGFPFAPYPYVIIDGHEYILTVECRDISPTVRSVNVEVYWDLERRAKTSFQLWVHI